MKRADCILLGLASGFGIGIFFTACFLLICQACGVSEENICCRKTPEDGEPLRTDSGCCSKRGRARKIRIVVTSLLLISPALGAFIGNVVYAADFVHQLQYGDASKLTTAVDFSE